MIVDIQGKKFDLDTGILDGMLSAAGQTVQDGKEHGFLFCGDPKGVVPGKKCTGNKCSINLHDCSGKNTIGSFHSHPDVISFSLADYVSSAYEAKGGDYLLCVSLLDQGIRCKALKQTPPKALLASLSHSKDSDDNRDKIKPYWTDKVNISTEAIKALAAGTPWAKLPESKEVCAIDEGPEVMKGDIACPVSEKTTGGQEMDNSEFKTLMQIAANWDKITPTGKYPWHVKEFTKSVAGPMGGVGLEKMDKPPLESEVTRFIDVGDIETPDKSLIHSGEVAQYIRAISPVVLTRVKDADGKWIVEDGRHRLVAWRAAGYRQLPVVFMKKGAQSPTHGKEM